MAESSASDTTKPSLFSPYQMGKFNLSHRSVFWLLFSLLSLLIS